MALQEVTREEASAADRSSKTARLRNDVIAAVEQFGADDMRGSWSNALEALVVAGLETMRRRKPLVRGLSRGPDSEPPAAA